MWPKRLCFLGGPSHRLHFGIQLAASSTHLVCAPSHPEAWGTSGRVHALSCVSYSLVPHPALHLQSVGLYMLL